MPRVRPRRRTGLPHLVTPGKTNFTASRFQDAICYSTSNSLQALRIRRHFETSKLPSFSASTNALNILTKSRKRRIHSSSPSFGWANAFPDKSVKIKAKLMRRVIARRSSCSGPFADEVMGAKLPVLSCAADRFTPGERDEQRIVAGLVLQAAIARSCKLRRQRRPNLHQGFGDHI